MSSVQHAAPNITPIEAIVRSLIKEHGPLSIARMMQEALLHPHHGYYTQHEPFGTEGDFITAPEISQMFGEMVGVWCAETWQKMGSPSSITLAELGPGRGTMMKDILRATRHISGFHAALSIHLIEASPRLRDIQMHNLANAHPNLSWHSSLNALPEAPLLLIANEFFDALPIYQFMRIEDEWRERKITINASNELDYTYTPTALNLMLSDHYKNAPAGSVIELCPQASEVLNNFTPHLRKHGGSALIIDYGYAEPPLRSTLQALKAHQHHPVLEELGTADITAHVDFLMLFAKAESLGLIAEPPIAQGTWLEAMGIHIRAEQLEKNATPEQLMMIKSGLTRLIDPSQMGELFKVLCVRGK